MLFKCTPDGSTQTCTNKHTRTHEHRIAEHTHARGGHGTRALTFTNTTHTRTERVWVARHGRWKWQLDEDWNGKRNETRRTARLRYARRRRRRRCQAPTTIGLAHAVGEESAVGWKGMNGAGTGFRSSDERRWTAAMNECILVMVLNGADEWICSQVVNDGNMNLSGIRSLVVQQAPTNVITNLLKFGAILIVFFTSFWSFRICYRYLSWLFFN